MATKNYAILRIAKLSTAGQIGAAQAHCLRTRPTPNADPELTPSNVTNMHPGSLNAFAEARRAAVQGNKAFRKNGVRMVEFVLTASPDALDALNDDDFEGWAAANLGFIAERYGKQNLAGYALHLDEQTPHLHVFITPVVDGKFNARALFGGRKKLADLQTDYAAAMKPFGLRRGIKNSKAKHQTIRQFYSKAKQYLANTQTLKKTWSGLKAIFAAVDGDPELKALLDKRLRQGANTNYDKLRSSFPQIKPAATSSPNRPAPPQP